MAAIDKTYTKSWDEYQDLIKWANENIFTCPDGTKLNISDSIYKHWTKESFDGTYRPVMNTSHVTDYYLIKYCTLTFVQERMKEVYDNEYVESVKNGTSEFDTFTKEGKYGTKCKLIKQPKKNMRGNTPCNSKKNRYWFIQIDTPKQYNFIDYCEDENRWIWPDELTSSNGWISNTCHRFKTRKAVERNICKWKLPKGTKVTVYGGYIGEEYIYIVK
jgi:hypothetical protein